MKQWVNLQDGFIRSRHKLKESKKSGAGTGTTTIKKYIYNEQMEFLLSIVQANIIQTKDHSIDGDEEENEAAYNALLGLPE